MDKELYTDFSAINLFIMLVARLIPIAAFTYCLPHYNENPVLISIICCFCVLAFLLFGYSYITVYADEIITIDDSLFSLFYKRKIIIKIADIESVYTKPLPPKNDTTDIGVALLLSFFLPARRSRIWYSVGDPVVLNLVNEKKQVLFMDTDDAKRQKVADLINSLITHNVTNRHGRPS